MGTRNFISYTISFFLIMWGHVVLSANNVQRPSETEINSQVIEQTYPDNNTQAQSGTIKWTEKDKLENEKIRKQLISKFENKVQRLGYAKVSSISIGDLNGNYATLNCPVKKGGDKVYTLVIFFKKYTEFEIIRVELWDEGNMTKMQLE